MLVKIETFEFLALVNFISNKYLIKTKYKILDN